MPGTVEGPVIIGSDLTPITFTLPQGERGESAASPPVPAHLLDRDVLDEVVHLAAERLDCTYVEAFERVISHDELSFEEATGEEADPVRLDLHRRALARAEHEGIDYAKAAEEEAR